LAVLVVLGGSDERHDLLSAELQRSKNSGVKLSMALLPNSAFRTLTMLS